MQATLDELRSELARVKAAPPTEPFDVEPTVDVHVLVGVERARLESELGPLEFCGQPLRSDAIECFYEFYYLPAGVDGGGTLLFMSFDGAGRCEGASWGAFK